MPGPTQEPIGRQLARTAKAVSRAFDDALTAAGGSRPMWLILLSLKRKSWETQAQLARSLDISGPTLTHHLDGLEQAGLITRSRDPDNRRVHIVELTVGGDAMFHHLRQAAARHDAALCTGIDADELDTLRELLSRLHDNVVPEPSHEADVMKERDLRSR